MEFGFEFDMDDFELKTAKWGWTIAMVLVAAVWAHGSGFVAWEVGSSFTLYVGPLSMDFSVGQGAWFPGRYL